MSARPYIAGTFLALACIVGFYELAERFAASPAIFTFDRAITEAIQALRHPFLTSLMRAVTTAGGTGLVTAAAIALTVRLAAAGLKRDAIFVGAVVSACGLISWTLKGVYGRVRPPEALALIELPSDFAFPSGHTIGSLALAGCVVYLAVRSRLRPVYRIAIATAALLYPMLVGVSRIYLGVHWPSDVLASWLLGSAVLFFAIGIRETARDTDPAATAPAVATE